MQYINVFKEQFFWYTDQKKETGRKVQKFDIGTCVKIKKGYPMAGYIGLIFDYFMENHTYLVYFNHDQKLFFVEKALELTSI